MENAIAYLKTEDGLEFRLTEEKLFIHGAGGIETFALRSINGVGVIDEIEKYNQELTRIKSLNEQVKRNGITFLIFGALCLFLCFAVSSFVPFIGTVTLGVLGFIAMSNSNKPLPEMKSSVRIMLNGMNRDFEFNKRKVNSTDVANFVARVEDTLTAFHKN